MGTTAPSPALQRFRKVAKATTSLMNWFLFEQGDGTEESEAWTSYVPGSDEPEGDTTLRLSEAIEEGIPPAEIFLQTSDLLASVTMVSIPNQGPDELACNLNDPRLWRVDQQGLYLRLFKDDTELLFGFDSFNLVLEKKPAMVLIDIQPNAAYTKLTPMTLSPDTTAATTLQVLRRSVIFSKEIAI